MKHSLFEAIQIFGFRQTYEENVNNDFAEINREIWSVLFDQREKKNKNFVSNYKMFLKISSKNFYESI